MADWYWMKDGKKHGPVDSIQLKQLARTGQLQPTDMIFREGLSRWVSASKIKGIAFTSLQELQLNSSDEPLAELASAKLPQHNQAATSKWDYQRTMAGKKRIRPITKVLVLLIGLVLIIDILFYFSSDITSKIEASKGQAELAKRLDEWIEGNDAIAPSRLRRNHVSLFGYEIKAFTPDTECLEAKYEGCVAYRATVILSFQREIGGEIKEKYWWLVYKKKNEDGPWIFSSN